MDIKSVQAVIIAREQEARQRIAELEQANVALTVRGGLLSVLAEATRKIVEAPDLVCGIHDLLRRLGESTQLSRVLFFLERASPSGGKEHYVVTEWCAPGISDHRSFGIEVIPNSVARPFLDRMQGRNAFWLDMQQAEEPMRSAVASMQTLSTGCAPVTVDGKYAGVVAFDDCVTVRSDEAAHVDAFLAAANIIGSALQRERATERRAWRTAMLESIVAASRHLLDSEDFDKGLADWLRQVGRAAGADAAGIGTLDYQEAVGAVVPTVRWTWTSEEHIARMDAGGGNPEVPLSTDFVDWIERLYRNETIWANYSDLRDPISRRYWDTAGCAGNALVPIPLEGGAKGFLFFDFSAEQPRDEDQISAIQTAANGLSSAMRRQASQVAMLAEREARVQELRRTQTALQETIDLIEDIDDIEHVVPRVLGIVAKTFGSSGACALYDHDPSGLVRLKYWHLGGRTMTPSQLIACGELNSESAAVVERLAEGFWVPDSDLGTTTAFAIGISLLDHRRGTSVPEFDRFAIQNGWDLELNIGVGAKNIRRATLSVYRTFEYPFSAEEHALAGSLAKHLGLAMVMGQLADDARQAAVLRQRELAASQRAEELAKVNNALQAAARGLIRDSKLADVLPTILQAAMEAAGAPGGAVLRRLDATTEFVFEVIIQDGVLLAGPDLEEHPFTRQVREVSRKDPKHYFARLAAGETVWRLADDEQAGPLDQSRRWHETRGQKAVWDIPFSVGNRVTGYLALAFTHSDSPSESIKETVNALATQVGLAMQLTSLAESDKRAAVLREQQQAVIQRAAELERSSEALQRTIDAVSELQTLNDFVPRALRIVAEAFGASSAAYWEHPEATIYLRFWLLDGAIYGPKELPGLAGDRYAVMTQLAEGFSVSREHLNADLHERIHPSIVHHATATASPALHQFALGMGWEWELNVPLIISGRAEGALTLYRGSGRPFNESEFALAEGLAKQMALAMRISGLAERERDAATAQAVALERLRIAAEMHDSLAQSFTSIALQSESLRSSTPESSAESATLQLIELTARQGLAEVRASVLTLHSLDGPPGTLDKALGQLAARCNVPGSIRCDFISKGEPCDVAPDSRESLMRIAREALNNAMRHSGGTRMQLTLVYAGGRVRLTVEDDGMGLTDDDRLRRPGYGLEGMSRRAEMMGGTLRLSRSELGGAMVEVDIPCLSTQAVRKDSWE